MNFNGFMQFARGMNGGGRGEAYLQAETRLLGLGGGYQRRAYQQRFLDSVRAFCASVHADAELRCTDGDVAMLQEMVDEVGIGHLFGAVLVLRCSPPAQPV